MKTSSFFHRYKEVLLGVFMLALAAFYLYHAELIRLRSTINVRVSAKLIPEILGVLVLGLGVAQLAQGIGYLIRVQRADAENGTTNAFVTPEEKRDAIPVILTFVLIVGYAMSLEWLGFVIASTACMVLQMLVLTPKGKARPLAFFVISLVTALVVYYIFRDGLSLMLPAGLMEFLPF